MIFTLTLPMASFAGRSGAAVAEFKRGNPCPVNGARRGPCPGHQVDHVEPLCAGGADAAHNMQWLTVAAHKQKTRFDVMRCRQLKRAAASHAS